MKGIWVQIKKEQSHLPDHLKDAFSEIKLSGGKVFEILRNGANDVLWALRESSTAARYEIRRGLLSVRNEFRGPVKRSHSGPENISRNAS